MFHALMSTTDFEIFQAVCAEGDTFAADRMERMLRDGESLLLCATLPYQRLITSASESTEPAISFRLPSLPRLPLPFHTSTE